MPDATIGSIDRYNPENIDLLEEHVNTLAESQSFDIEACMAVLKLYQFNVDRFNVKVVVKILLMAIMQLPDPAFMLCLYLLPEDQLANEHIGKAIYLQQLLETCNFDQFWEEVKSCENELLDGVKGFDDHVRIFIEGVVTRSHQSIEATNLRTYLHMEEAHFQGYVKDHPEWIMKDGVLHFGKDMEAEVKPKNIVERIDFNDLTNMMASSMRR
eukprot:Clim_evm71s218 gene=Clim_evmTU71s218